MSNMEDWVRAFARQADAADAPGLGAVREISYGCVSRMSSDAISTDGLRRKLWGKAYVLVCRNGNSAKDSKEPRFCTTSPFDDPETRAFL